MSSLEAIQSTNDDAVSCKRSTVHYGYYEDPFIEHFCKLGARKTPEIHLGYYTRVKGMKLLLDKVIQQMQSPVQIINLGAGYDTLYWRLKDEVQLKCFVDVDLPEVTAKKCMMIKKSHKLMQKLKNNEVTLKGSDLHSNDYHVIAADFTNIPQFTHKLDQCKIDYKCPTIFISECVLVYIETSKSDNFIKWCNHQFSSPIVFIDYEQVNLNDRFGQIMLQNLIVRGCGLEGASACDSKDTLINRFTSNGWNGAKCWTMNEVYSELLDQNDVDRVEKLEMLDEKEIMKQLFQHYSITVSWKNSNHVNFNEDVFI